MSRLIHNQAVSPEQSSDLAPLAVSNDERQQILVEWNRTERDYPREKCVHQLFEEQAARTPEAVAVVGNGISLTYGEINAQANRLAQHLHSLGVGPNVLVGLVLERSPEMIIALLGILKVGGAYWALEEHLSAERLAMLLADARPRVLLARKDCCPELAGSIQKAQLAGQIETITTMALEELLESSPAEAVLAAPPDQAASPAYVCYTSGTTGHPKGVVVPHRGVVRLVKGTNYVSLSENETLLQLSPLSFDASTFEIWGALLNGGRLVLMPPGPPTLAEIGETIRQYGVTTLWLTAGLFHLMVDERLDDLKPLRQLLSGGDVLSPERVRKAFHALPGCRIINGYGPTENTTFTCCHVVTNEAELTPSVPIGRPIANTKVYVLDASLQPVPVGATGELYAGGDGVACGYLNHPELTAERFLQDPFSSRPGARIYRTGDLARWRSDGSLEFLGRLDQQIKIRGYRVELSGIEAVLSGHPEVSACVALAVDRDEGDKVLVAYVVRREPSTLAVDSLRQWLEEKLPHYMIPARFVLVPALPLSPNGKLDRKALRSLEISGGDMPSPIGQPANLLEWELTRTWRRLFRRDDIGPEDNFFALGGDSLMAARVVAEIDKLCGCKLPIASLFQAPTIESLARQLTNQNWAPPWSSLVPLQPQGSKPPLFFFHGCGGDVYGFLELAKLLPADQPSYGIQAVGLDGRSARHATVEAMAAHYVQEIISFQPAGHVFLAGYSMGGLIAYEVAQQLHRSGREVALLALLDTAPLNQIPWVLYAFSLVAYLPRRCWIHFRHWCKLPRGESFKYVRGRLAALRILIVQNVAKPQVVTAPPPPDHEAPHIEGFIDYYHAVASAYAPPPFPGSATVIISEEVDYWWRWWYWKYFIRGKISCFRVPGSHAELLSPTHLLPLAKLLTMELDRAQAKANTLRPLM